jgi:hypothetical protein
MTQWPHFALRTWVWIALLTHVLGCGSRAPQRSGADARGQSPRARFDGIVERFKRHCSGSSILVPTRTGDSLVLRFVLDDVTYHVAGCDSPSASCTAEMTVKTSTHYSLLTGLSPSPDAAAEGAGPRSSVSSGTSKNTAEAPQQKQPPHRQMTAEKLLGRKSQEKTETYQFAFEQGRWVLKTEEVDPSVKESLVFALRRQ